MPNRRDPETGLCRRGTSNGNERGSSETRRRRKHWLLETYRANVDVLFVEDYERIEAVIWSGADARYLPDADGGIGIWLVPVGKGEKAARCFRCGHLLTFETLTVDRIIPGCKGGTYRRNNIRPACGDCNSETGGALASKPKKRKKISAPRPLRALESA